MAKNILRGPEVRRRTGLSKSTLYDLMARNQFPRPIALSPEPGGRSVGWLDDEVEAWIEQRVRASREQDSKQAKK